MSSPISAGLLGAALVMGAQAHAQPKSIPSTALAAAKASATPAAVLSPGQLDAARRVLTGPADCEFGQTIRVTAIDGRPGHFRLDFGKKVHLLVVQETSTGAVRLEDHRSGVVWLQIPAKSMLLNTRIGQRLVDSCMHEMQRAAVAPAGSSLGIEETPPAPAVDATVPDLQPPPTEFDP
jgi:hypothetical protein